VASNQIAGIYTSRQQKSRMFNFPLRANKARLDYTIQISKIEFATTRQIKREHMPSHLATSIDAGLIGAIAIGCTASCRVAFVEKILWASASFLFMCLIASILGTTMRAIGSGVPNAIIEGVIHGFGAWGYLLFLNAAYSLPALFVCGGIVHAAQLIFGRRREPPADSGEHSTGDVGRFSLRTMLLWVTVSAVMVQQTIDAYQNGGWWIPR
jgi:hypothetical protein